MNFFGPHRLPSYLVIIALAISTVSLLSSSYHLVKQIRFDAAEGGHEYYDYLTLDAAKRRLYLSHGTEVKVVDADTGAIVGGAKTMALDPKTHNLYLTTSDFGAPPPSHPGTTSSATGSDGPDTGTFRLLIYAR